jgi:hypothetical protein
MGNYLFRIPAGCPELTAEGLTAWMQRAYPGQDLRYGDHRMIGATVTVTYRGPLPGRLPAENGFTFRLYDLDLAVITRTRISFTGTDDPHMATTYWVTQILHDNAIPKWVGRRRRRKSDGDGPMMARGMAGVLEAGAKPVFGGVFRVGDIAEMKRKHAEWAAESARMQAEFAEASRRREALRTYTGPEGSAYASDANSTEYHWRVIDATFRDGGYYYDTIGFVRDGRDDNEGVPSGYLGHLIHGSLEPDASPLSTPFEAFTLTGELIDAYHDLHGALAAVLHQAVVPA